MGEQGTLSPGSVHAGPLNPDRRPAVGENMTDHGQPSPGTASGSPAGGNKPSPPKLTHSQARYLAESIWGHGGTVSHRTNRTGAFWFSCSAHGGFIIDDRALTRPERERLSAAGLRADSCWGVRGEDGRIITVRHPGSHVQNPRTVTCYPGRGEYADRNIPVWTLEEDCEWAAAYSLTGIRAPDAFGLSEDRLIDFARKSYPQASEPADPAPPETATPAGGASAGPAAAARKRSRTTGRKPPHQNTGHAPGS